MHDHRFSNPDLPLLTITKAVLHTRTITQDLVDQHIPQAKNNVFRLFNVPVSIMKLAINSDSCITIMYVCLT